MTGRVKTTCSRLRHRLTLQQEIETPDEAGGYARSWEDVADLWAEVIPLGVYNSHFGKEVLFAGQIQAEVSHRIVLRYRDDIAAGMRLVFEGRAFNIRSVANQEERKETLVLLVQEGVAA